MNYLQTSLDFIENSKRCPSLRALAELFYKTISSMGCTHFICLSHVDVFNPPDDAVILSNYPMEWGLYHNERQYHKVDPVMQSCKSRITPFTWSNDNWRAMLTKEKTKILNEASEFQLGEGHTIPIHSGEGYDASCSVVFKPGHVDPQALMSIQLMAVYLYEAALKMRTNEAETKKKLTERQKQCLEYIAQGKSDWTISKLLGISENTVRFHVKEILKRYKVGSRNQAIIRALFVGEITFLDVITPTTEKSNEVSGLVHLQT